MAVIRTDVTYYQNTGIAKARHLAFDDVDSYLGREAIGGYTVTDVMLQPDVFNMLDVTLKLDLSATIFLADKKTESIDYVKVEVKEAEQSVTNRVFYYFVNATKWRSTSTLALECSLDVLATYPLKTASDTTGKGILLHEHTVTHRKHKDRFQSYSSSNRNAVRIVDRFDEGVNPLLFKTLDETLYDSLEPNLDPNPRTQWNLIYRNANYPDVSDYHQINPVECHMAADDDVTVNIGGHSNNAIVASGLTGTIGYVYILQDGDLYGVQFTDSYGVHFTIGSDGEPLHCICVYPNGTVSLNVFDGSAPADVRLSGSYITVDDPLVTSLDLVNCATPFTGDPTAVNFVYNLQPTSETVAGIHVSPDDGGMDRTDPRLIKICKIPYSPMALTYSAGSYDVPSGWEYDRAWQDLHLLNINARFKRTMYLAITDNPYRRNLLVAWDALEALPGTGQTRDKRFESKLKHSSFHMCKYVYDSFSLPLLFECAKTTGLTVTNLGTYNRITCEYVVSTTFSGNFAFYFKECATVFDGGAMEDYPFRISVARNNQEPIFTSSYLDYVRTGYNYDVKSKNYQLTQSAIGIGASVAGGLVAGAMTGNPIGAAIGAGIGLVSSLLSTINSQMNAENQIQQKLQTARMQAVAISASDDVDLLVDYSENRLKYVEYSPSEAIENALYDLFYYYGYACNDTGIPNIKSRYYFDFLQADAELTTNGNNVPDAFLDEAKRRISEGVTIIHSPMSSAGLLECTYENWETSLFSL